MLINLFVLFLCDRRYDLNCIIYSSFSLLIIGEM